MKCLEEAVPIRWLFEDELKDGKKKYQIKAQENKLKKEQKKLQAQQKRAELIASAKAKLTPEELKAIKCGK